MPSNPVWAFTGSDLQQRVLFENFEHFCHELIEYEVNFRHPGGVVVGPSPRFRKDRGRDLQATTVGEPTQDAAAFGHALTVDSAGTTCFACKTGDNWRSGLLEDAGKDVPAEIVKNGGHFTMLVNRPLLEDDREPLMQEAADKLSKKSGMSAEQLNNHVHLRDGEELANFFAFHPVQLDPRLRLALGIQRTGVYSFEEWGEFLRNDRSLPTYAPDSERDNFGGDLEALVTREAEGPEVVWLFGAPGVGKTRLVFESLAGSTSTLMRVAACPGFDLGLRAIEEWGLPELNDGILVVDECPFQEARSLAARFVAKAHGIRNTLILVGPQRVGDSPGSFPGRYLSVDPLDPGATRQLIQSELGAGVSPPDVVERIFQLTEGYPWFAVLVARALAQDPTAFAIDSDQKRAADLAIGGPANGHASHQDWEVELLLRKKALLAVILTEDQQWSPIDPELANKVSAVLGEPWDVLYNAAHRCYRRGILRMAANWRYKYITPNNLARIVANELLSHEYPIAEQLKIHLPAEQRATIYHRLEALGVGEELLKDLADEELASFLVQTIQELGKLPLTFLARYQPRRIGRLVREIIEKMPASELKLDTNARRSLVFALAHIARRKNGFVDAEAGLFRLALAENESWGNNATGIWKSLFLALLSLTFEAFSERLRILRGHLSSLDEDERLLGLLGLDDAVAFDERSPGYTDYDKADGDWPRPSTDELLAGKAEAWNMLARISTDASDTVAHEARKIATNNLRGAIRWGLGELAITPLISMVEQWTPRELADLRAKVEDARRYDSDYMGPDVEASLQELVKLVSPQDYHSRLLDVVGHWGRHTDSGPGGNEERELEVDRAVALDGLKVPALTLAEELKWLDTPEAVRALQFMFNVGRVDSDMVLLDPLITLLRDGHARDIFGTYLAGLVASGHREVAEQVLRDLHGTKDITLAVLLASWRIGPSAERIQWVIDDLRSGALHPDQVGYLSYGPWGAQAPPKSLNALIKTLATFESDNSRTTALDLLLQLARPDKVQLKTTLAKLVVQLASAPLRGLGEYSWERGCRLALELGATSSVLRASLLAVNLSESYELQQSALKILREVAVVDPIETWQSLSAELEDEDHFGLLFLFDSLAQDVLTAIPVATIMDWVGYDQKRSTIIASMCSLHNVELPEIARQLLIRFGSNSPVASGLAARAHTTEGAVSSLAEFAAGQLALATNWATDDHPAVADWANRLADEMRSMHEEESAREEYEQKRLR